MKTKTFISGIVSVALLIIYVYFFGQNSIRKYVDNAVFVTTLEEKPKYITPPGKYNMFFPMKKFRKL